MSDLSRKRSVASMPLTRVPFIVGLGGTTRVGSSSELVLRHALAAAAALGAQTQLFGGADLLLPIYDPGTSERVAGARILIDALRRADGIIIASPGYHGSLSGLVKNAIDYVEDMRQDVAPYFEGRAVGCIACALGNQATGATLNALRSIVHALRGWPTPLGVAINTTETVFSEDGSLADFEIACQLKILAQQVVEFAGRQGSGYERVQRTLASVSAN